MLEITIEFEGKVQEVAVQHKGSEIINNHIQDCTKLQTLPFSHTGLQYYKAITNI